MANVLVRRDQFNITPQGIVHKPTDAAFTPYPGDPYSGITRLGHLSNKHPNGNGFNPEDVQRMMWELWVEYVIGDLHPELKGADPGPAGFIGRDLQIQIEGPAREEVVRVTGCDWELEMGR